MSFFERANNIRVLGSGGGSIRLADLVSIGTGSTAGLVSSGVFGQTESQSVKHSSKAKLLNSLKGQMS